RTLVLFDRLGNIRGQIVEDGATAGVLDLVGSDFAVASGNLPVVSVQRGTDVFFASVRLGSSVGFGCIAGQRIIGTPSAGAELNTSLPFVSSSLAGGACLAFRHRTGTIRSPSIRTRASIVAPLAPLQNSAPVAPAGSDLEVTENAIFNLDGTASADADGDPLRHRWARTGGGSS